MKICPSCGMQLENAEKFCRNCGAKQPGMDSNVNMNTNTNTNPGMNTQQNPNVQSQGYQYRQDVNRGMQYQDYRYQNVQQQPVNGLAVAGMVLSIIGAVLSWFTFSIPSILGLIFSIVAMRQCKREGKGGYGMAVAGLVISIIVLFIYIIIFVFVLGAFSRMFSPYYWYSVFNNIY